MLSKHSLFKYRWATCFVLFQRVTIQDLVRGQVSWDAEATVGDFILLRSTGVPVYNFCVAGENVCVCVCVLAERSKGSSSVLKMPSILFLLPSGAF